MISPYEERPANSVNVRWKGKQKLDTKMPKFWETRQLFYAHCDNLINDEIFLLLYDFNTIKNLDLEY